MKKREAAKEVWGYLNEVLDTPIPPEKQTSLTLQELINTKVQAVVEGRSVPGAPTLKAASEGALFIEQSNSRTNKQSAQTRRNRGPFSELVRRTIDGLLKSGPMPTVHEIVIALGLYDEENILGYIDESGAFKHSTDSAGKKSYYKPSIQQVTCFIDGTIKEYFHKDIADRRYKYLKPSSAN
jgi:hypothetical protein